MPVTGHYHVKFPIAALLNVPGNLHHLFIPIHLVRHTCSAKIDKYVAFLVGFPGGACIPEGKQKTIAKANLVGTYR
jgi:hypothetical protein